MFTEDFSEMELPLGRNEFTTSELLTYLKGAYGTKLNGSEFTTGDIIDWVKSRVMPVAYGGLSISSRRLSGLRILNVEGLEREDVKYLRKITKTIATPIKKKKRAVHKKKRTVLYYKLAHKPVPEDALPNDWHLYANGQNLKNNSKRRKQK